MRRGARSFTAAATFAALTLAACGGSNGVNVDDPAPTSAEQDEVEPAPVTQAAPAPAPDPDDSSDGEPADEPGGGSSLADAAPLVGETIEWADDKFAWSLDLHGLTAIPSDDPDEGACVALAGTATPTQIWELTPYSPFSGRPLIELQTDGESVEMNGNTGGCDTSEFAQASYLLFRDMFVSLGSSYNFVATFQLESGDIDDVEAVVFASADDSEAILTYYLPTIADGIAPPVPPTSDYSNLSVLPADVGTISVDAAFDRDSTNDHDVQIQGIVGAPADEIGSAGNGPGSCLVIVGSKTVTDTDGDFASGGGPNISILIGGHRLFSRNSMCDVSETESAGYISGTRALTGTSYDFYEAVFVPEFLANADVLIAIDDHTGHDTQLLMPTMLDALPTPLDLPNTYTVPPTLGSMTAAPILHQAGSGLPEYTMSPIGFFIGDLNEQGSRRCVQFLATVVADGNPAWRASISVLSSGRVHGSGSAGCDGAIVESAGYQQSTEAKFVPGVGVGVAVYTTFSIPLDEVDAIEALVVGSTRDGDVPLFDPVFVDTIPEV